MYLFFCLDSTQDGSGGALDDTTDQEAIYVQIKKFQVCIILFQCFLSVTWESQIFVSILSSRCTIFALSFEFVYFINVNYHPSSDWWWIITDCVKIPVSNHIVWYRWRLIFAQIFMLYAWCACSCVHLQYWMLYLSYSNCCCLVNKYLRNLTPLVS